MSSPIKDVFRTLNQHSGVVEEALGGVVDGEGPSVNSSITALRQISALKPAGEEGYRLHQKLREYLHDHLQMFPAFQSLAEISSRITQVNSLWLEIDQGRRTRDVEVVNRLIDTIQTTVFDIGDSMERNMLLLQTLIQTRYGNVQSLAAKKSQNRYYQQQTHALAEDLVRLARVVDKVEREASDIGMEDLSRFLRRNLLSRILHWQQGMSEMQTQIRRELFRLKEIERDLKLLARMDMLMRQQPSWRGFEIDLDGDIPEFLLVASMPPFNPQIEPLDNDTQMVEEMQRLVASMPPREAAAPDPKPPLRYTRIVDAPCPPVLSPAARALKRLQAHANKADEDISLSQWQLHDADACTMAANIWLMFAIMGLRTAGYAVDVVPGMPRIGERFTHSIRDALVRSRAKAMHAPKHALTRG
jgi:hypothetical protein